MQKANAQRLTEQLKDIPGLILPSEPAGVAHNWYNYTMRFDMELCANGHLHDASAFRCAISKAMQAEGVQTSVWQAFILPAMTVFQARNGYGKGCPWSCPHAQPVDYSLSQFTTAQRHCDAHTGMTMPLRAAERIPMWSRLTARGIRKVMENLDQL